MKYRKRENIKTISDEWNIWIMMKRVIPTLAEMGKNYRLHMYAAQSQKQAIPAKKVFINAALGGAGYCVRAQPQDMVWEEGIL